MTMPLFKHQADAVSFVAARGGSGCLFHDPGLGKTRTALEIFKAARIKEPSLRLLVIAPLSLLEAAWRNDAEKFFPGEWRVFNCHKEGFDDKNADLLSADILAVNYEFFQNEQ